MQYRVIKAFQDVDGFRQPGDVIEVSGWREVKLRQARIIGQVVSTTAETADAEPGETADAPPAAENATAKKPRERRG
jgi:hypothetical protein